MLQHTVRGRLSYPPFPLLPLPPLLNVFYLNLSCVYSFCFVLLNFTCLWVAVCLSMFLLIKLFFKHIIKHCTNRTRYPDPAGMIAGYPDPVPRWKTAIGCALLWNIGWTIQFIAFGLSWRTNQISSREQQSMTQKEHVIGWMMDVHAYKQHSRICNFTGTLNKQIHIKDLLETQSFFYINRKTYTQIAHYVAERRIFSMQ